ncbi:MAG: hypothetical protein AAF550_10525, partial [Myxococcota bacterium]
GAALRAVAWRPRLQLQLDNISVDSGEHNDEQFTFRLLDTRDSMGEAWDGYVLQLRPRSPSPHFEQVLFYVRLVEGAGIVERVLIVDPVGNRNLFEFRGLRFTSPIEERYFEFRFPEGTRIVTP